MSTIIKKPDIKTLLEFPKIKFTGNSLKDVTELIKKNNIIALHTTNTLRVFHNLDSVDLSKRRVIYIDCSSSLALLGKGEWDFYIKKAIPKVIELSQESKLRDTIRQQTQVPNKRFFKINS